MSRPLTKFGLHYFHDDLHYTQADWAHWGPRIASIGAGWLTLHASEKRAVPESFLRSVINEGIQPIIHIPAKIGSVSLREIAPILKSYADWGVRHVAVFDRPNTQSSWNSADWSRGELIDRFADIILPLLHVELEVGLQPMLPPFEPGGDYWDTAFLEALLSVLERRGQSKILDSLGIALFAWTNGQSLDWGKGGPDAWPETRPYSFAEGSEDHLGFRIYEWYQSIIKRVIGREIPLYVLAGGSRQGFEQDSSSPDNRYGEIYNFLLSDEAPNYLSCFNVEVFDLDADENSPDFQALSSAIHHQQRNHRRAANAKTRKTIEHYALLPAAGTQHAMDIWQNSAIFVMAVQPTVGFSVEDARYASKVTILASTDQIPPEAQEFLEDSGCEVTRIDTQKDEKLIDAIAAFATERDQAGGKNE